MRAVLKSEEGKPAAAIDDLLPSLDREPRNYDVMVRLGQAYLVLDRAHDAAQVLKQAADLAPDAPSVLTGYVRAREKLGDKEAERAILARLKQTGTAVEGPKRCVGLIDYLSLPPIRTARAIPCEPSQDQCGQSRRFPSRLRGSPRQQSMTVAPAVRPRLW